jgi:hypothetical protein
MASFQFWLRYGGLRFIDFLIPSNNYGAAAEENAIDDPYKQVNIIV